MTANLVDKRGGSNEMVNKWKNDNDDDDGGSNSTYGLFPYRFYAAALRESNPQSKTLMIGFDLSDY